MSKAGGVTHPYILDQASSQFQVLPTDPLTTTSGITVDDAGSVYIQHVNELWQMPPGGGFQPMGKGQQWYIDAGAANVVFGLSGTYSDNQNDLYSMTWPNDWVYGWDEMQNMKVNDPSRFTAVDRGFVSRYGGSLIHITLDGTNETLSSQSDLDNYQKYSAASMTEIYAVNKRTNAVARLDRTDGTFKNPIPPPPTKAIQKLEAASGGQLWIVTTDGLIYRYAPAATTP
jgi:hypothetical protein